MVTELVECPVCHKAMQQDRPCPGCSFSGFYEGLPCFVERWKYQSLTTEARRYGIWCAENVMAQQEGWIGPAN
jgi:hypothetical protein